MLNPSFAALVKNSPILPVLHMESAEDAVNVSRALYLGGITCAEIVLRSPVALDCIKAVSEQVPEMTVGVGTLTTPQQVKDSVAAGALANFTIGSGCAPMTSLTRRLIPFMHPAGDGAELPPSHSAGKEN